MRSSLLALAVVAFASEARTETITATDGRRFELNSDGTYKLLDNDVSAPIALVEQEPYFEHFEGEYNQNSIRFMPIYRNETGKTVIGFKFRTEFRSAFDDLVFSFEGESSERIADGAVSTAETFWYFEDNQFIGNEAYDKLKIFQGSGTGKIVTKVTAVAFEDGVVQKADP